MVGWVKQTEDNNLPKWLTDNIKSHCECGYEMENLYNKQERLSKRRCSNPKCPFKVALKIVGLCDILQIEGIGEANALKLVKNHNLNHQYEALPHLMNEKVRVNLYTFLRLAFIEGIDTSWGEVTKLYDNLDDVFEKYNGKYKDVLYANKELLYDGLKYVDLQQAWKPKYEPVLTGTVMISGSLRGWDNRNDFITGINYVMDGLVSLNVAESARKTNVLALIQEADQPNRTKAAVAKANGIPIKTPKEFQEYIMAEVAKRLQQ
ncbi:MAG: hypothetical protein IJE43_19245 [Alphaproteobacteria bacterium]|nr:hypothetical protein [Alphaproteobacteria bacterium]